MRNCRGSFLCAKGHKAIDLPTTTGVTSQTKEAEDDWTGGLDLYQLTWQSYISVV